MLKKYRIDPSIIFDKDTQEGEFKDTVVKGSIATGLSQGVAMGFTIISAVVLARLLTPDDFGLLGMVSVIVNFLFIFKDIGLSNATIQKEEITRPQISTLFWINSLISLSLGLIMVAVGPLVARFYDRAELTGIMTILAISFVVEGLTIQHTALLRRHLRFSAVAIADIMSRFSFLVTAIIMALLGFSYWSLVGGHIVRSMVLLGFTIYTCPWVPGRMQRGAGVRSMMRFGGHVTTGNLLAYLARNLDRILIGKLYGAAALGLYRQAYQLLMQPLTQVKYPLQHLSLPVLSSLQKEPERYRRYFSKLLDISISIALPVAVYCFLESEFLIRVALGPQWAEAAPIFRILAIGGIFVSASFLPGLALLSYGYSKKYMQLLIATSIIQSLSFVAGSPFGINGIAIAYTVSSFLVLIPMVILSFRGTSVNARLFFLTIVWPFLSAASAGALAYALFRILPQEGIVSHLVMALVYFILYTALTLVRKETRNTLISIWKSIISNRKKSAVNNK
ncbi:MAG: lipopolysaccharide biosynthesis protein [Bacteroidales bacterium]|nr:lipopolysaccharide biosynthesis protein [Bacteroidales bacterium]